MADSAANISIANRIRVSAIAREACARSAEQGGAENTLWQTAWSTIFAINSRFAALAPSALNPALLDIDMHDLWHTFWHGAINTGPGSPGLDRLALHVIQVREQGTLAKVSPATGDETTEGAKERIQAVTSDGARLWSDLPYLVQDMTAHWINDCASMSSSQRLSGAEFLALLAAAGAAPNDALCGIALVVLREALETPRPLGRLTPTERNPDRKAGDLSIAELLPAANAWLCTGGRRIIELSDAERNQFPDEVGPLGELVLRPPPTAAPGTSDNAAPTGGFPSGHGEPPRHGGFSPQRWTWWLRRLEEIAALAQQAEHANEVGEDRRTLPSLVEGMMDNMLLIAEQTNGPVKQALQKPGGLVRHKPAIRLLGPGRPSTAGSGN